MTKEEIIRTLEIASAEVEWDYSLAYSIAFEEAEKLIKHSCPYAQHDKDGNLVCEKCNNEVVLKRSEDDAENYM